MSRSRIHSLDAGVGKGPVPMASSSVNTAPLVRRGDTFAMAVIFNVETRPILQACMDFFYFYDAFRFCCGCFTLEPPHSLTSSLILSRKELLSFLDIFT